MIFTEAPPNRTLGKSARTVKVQAEVIGSPMTEVRNTQLARDREYSVAGQFFESVRACHLRAERPRRAQVLVPARGSPLNSRLRLGYRLTTA